jgi:hypothetical protein
MRLRDVSALAGVKPDAVGIGFGGTDDTSLSVTLLVPKSLRVERAMDETVLVAGRSDCPDAAGNGQHTSPRHQPRALARPANNWRPMRPVL